MKIEDYIKSLPEKIITGEDVQLSASTLREILEFADIGGKDVFYHLGCGDGAGPAIAFAARTDMEYCPFVRSATMSVIVFFIVFGVATFEATSFNDRSASCMVTVFSFSVGNLIKPLQKRRRFPL